MASDRPHRAHRRPAWLGLWLGAGTVWLALTGLRASHSWPHMPLDISGSDAEIEAAVSRHVLHAALLGLGVPAIGYLVLHAFWPGHALETKRSGIMSNGGPARILLMRHAEKTGDPADKSLSSVGKTRAENLAQYIPETFGKPDAIFAARQSKHSNRSVETVEPLAAATGNTLDKSYKDDDYGALVERLTSDPGLTGKSVVVCWHHSDLPEIAEALGAPPGSYPKPWDPTVFNMIIDMRFAPGSQPEISQIIEPF